MSRGQTAPPRPALIAALNDETGRKLSTAAILFQLAIADRLGLGLTDLVCGEILARTGSITAGELAELSGLTTGAITGVVDRLEKVGFVRRVSDPHDRRRVMLEPQYAQFDRASGNPYHALEQQFNALYQKYSDPELALVLEFLRQSTTILDEQAMRLRSPDSAPAASAAPRVPENLNAPVNARARTQADRRAETPDAALIQIRRGGTPQPTRTFATPRGELGVAQWKWISGGVNAVFKLDPAMTDLYRATFTHDIPIVRDHNGAVSIHYRHRTLFGRGGGRAKVVLNPAAAWDFDFECGASQIQADLRELVLRGFVFKSKASKVTLRLPPPSGTVRLHFESPVSDIRIEYPKRVPVHLEFQGDWSTLVFERKKFDVSSETRESPDYKRASNRYLIEFVGGASKVTVEESK